MSKARWPTLVMAVLAGLAITVFFVARSQIPTVRGAFEVGTNGRSWFVTVLTAGYGFAMTLLGVFIGAAYRRLIELRSTGEDRARLRQVAAAVWGSIDFQIGLVGSPLIFGLLWQSIDDISLAGITVIALQNGFTSHAVLDRVVPHDQVPAPAREG